MHKSYAQKIVDGYVRDPAQMSADDVITYALEWRDRIQRVVMRNTFTICVAAILVILGGCGRSSQEGGKDAQVSSEPGLTADEANGATIAGKISFAGQKPALHEIDFSANPACQKMHPAPVYAEDVVVNDNGTLANAFVWLKTGVPLQAARYWRDDRPTSGIS
jgi:hypothetical protein